MNNQNLLLNILPIDWPEEEVSFYFHKDVQPNCYRLKRRFFPRALRCVFPDAEDAELESMEFVYTSFDRPVAGFASLDIDLQFDNPELVKLYFQYKVYTYLQGMGNMLMGSGFKKGVQVWVPAFKNHTTELLSFECFLLRVQMGSVSASPELLIRYQREVKVCKQDVRQMLERVSPALLEWLVVGNRMVRYSDYVQEENADCGIACAVLNKNVRKVLGIAEPTLQPCNPYKKHLLYTKGFYSKFLDNDAFREVLPIHHEFMRTDPDLVWRLPYTAEEWPFGCGAGMGAGLRVGSGAGLVAKKSPHAHIHLFFIAHKRDARLVNKVKGYFLKGVGQYPGLGQYTYLNVHPQKDMDIIFEDIHHTLPFIKKALDYCLHRQPADVTYMAVYISPYAACEPDAEKGAIYYQVKHALLERGIVSQMLEAAKLSEPKVAYELFLPGISVAMLAKLGGIPWRLKSPVQQELVIGVGVYEKDGERLLGISTSFSNEGRFEGFECFHEDQMVELAGYVSYVTRKYAKEHGYPKRLVIHCVLKGCNRELVSFERVIKELKFPKPLPVFFVRMFGKDSEDVVGFDTGWEELMPYSGTVVKVGVHTYLLFNNMRYVGDGKYGIGGDGSYCGEGYGFSLPVKVEVDCTDRELLQDECGVIELLDGVHQFSRMNWRGCAAAEFAGDCEVCGDGGEDGEEFWREVAGEG